MRYTEFENPGVIGQLRAIIRDSCFYFVVHPTSACMLENKLAVLALTPPYPAQSLYLGQKKKE